MDTSFFGIGMPELILIAVIALIVLGPERIPGAMREVAKWAKQVRDISNEFQNQFSDEIKMLDEINPRKLMNDVMDPKANPAPGPVTPPSTAAGAAAITSATTTVGGATVLPSGVSITNGEPSNSILPPSKADAAPAQSDSTSPSPAEPPPSDEAPGRSSDGAVGD